MRRLILVTWLTVVIAHDFPFAADFSGKDTGSVSVSEEKQVTDDDGIIVEENKPVLAPESKDTAVVQVSDSATNSNAATVAPAASAAKAAKAIIEDDDELILEGDEEDILEPAKPEQKKAAAKSSPAAAAGQTPAASKSETAGNDAVPADSGTISEREPEVLSKSTDIVKTPAVEKVAVVENPKSINFARNLRDYRSPKIAMLLSLIIPGAGQAYARNYWKTGAFVAVEAALIGVGVGFNVKGSKKKKDAHRYADAHFSIDSAEAFFNEFFTAIRNENEEKGDSIVRDIALTLIDSVYLYNPNYTKSSGYYNYLADNDNMVHGWDDAEPGFMEILGSSQADTIKGKYGSYVLSPDNPQNTDNYYRVDRTPLDGNQTTYDKNIFGYSEHMVTYSDMMSVANSYYRTSGTVLTFLLVNHIVSAIDAGITAKSHNARLLGSESFWHRIEIEQKFVNTGSETVPGYALQVVF